MKSHRESEEQKHPIIVFYSNTIIFFLFLLLGILLRLYRISQESISLEEYACIANLNLPSLLEFIREQRNTYPYDGILFPLLQYCWGKYFGIGIVSLRLFSICFWIAFYLMFWFVLNQLEKQNKLPPQSKIIVAIGITLSPALIFIGQEARMYMAYMFFVWCSFFIFIYMLEKSQNTLYTLLWILVNQLLLWTHHLGIVIWAAEFLLLFLFQIKGNKNIKRILFLAGIHSILLLPWLFWIITIPPQPSELHQYYLKPSLGQLISFPFILNLVGKGAICPIGILNPWQYSYTTFGSFLHHSQTGFEIALIIFSAMGFLGLLYGGIKGILYKTKNHIPCFFISLFVIPPIVLFIMAQVGPPVFTTRYIVFLIPLHFLGLSYFLQNIRKSLRLFALFFLITSLFYQFGIMTKSAWRMDWKQVGKTITETAGKNDLVIIRNPFWKTIFNINNPDFHIPVVDAYTEEGLTQLTSQYFASIKTRENTKTKVWIVIPDVYGTGLNIFPNILQQYKLPFFVYSFPGEQKIYLYLVTYSDNFIPQKIFTFHINTTKLIRRLFRDFYNISERFYKQHLYDHDRTHFHFIRTALVLAKHKKYNSADYLLKYAWEQNPNLIIQTYKEFSNAFHFQKECNLLLPSSQNTNISSMFWNGVQCFSEEDYEGALTYFSTLTKEYSEEPLFWWFHGNTYDKLGKTETADWSWSQLFHLQPLLPLGWHFIYQPSTITCDRTAFDNAIHRAEKLQIITEHLQKDIDLSLLK